MGQRLRKIKGSVYRFVHRMFAAIHLLPVVGSFVLFAVFAWNGQVGELYLRHIERSSHLLIFLLAVILSVVFLVLYFTYMSLTNVRVDYVYSQESEIRADTLASYIRGGVACFVAFILPILGGFLGIRNLLQALDSRYISLTATLNALQKLPYPEKEVLSLIKDIGTAKSSIMSSSIEMLFMILLIVILMLVLSNYVKKFRYSKTTIYASIVILFIVSVIYALWCPEEPDWLYRMMGPLVTGLTVLTLFYMLVWLLAIVRVKWGFALLSSIVVVWALFNLWTLPHVLNGPAETRKEGTKNSAHTRKEMVEVEKKFRLWLSKRADRTSFDSTKQRYPVFIVAAQGGGIYAATQTAIFLSRLQDLCPGFSQHVFAVSGVSGGSVGASVFHAIVRKQHQVRTAHCFLNERKKGGIEKQATMALQFDHLSAVIGAFPKDTMRSLAGFAFELRQERASALERSLGLSTDMATQIGMAGEQRSFSKQSDSAGISGKFHRHWRIDTNAPALILNATSVETGHRIAFSPFALKEIGDGTLYSFSDLDPSIAQNGVSIAKAAVVSSRFPLIMPPFKWKKQKQNVTLESVKEGFQIWNFVDGGYADNSGATTAYDLYKTIRSIEKSSLNFQVHLIILTSRVAEVTYDSIDGKSMTDTNAIISALLRVRDLLGSQAVTRVRNRVAEAEPAETVINRKKWRLKTVVLNRKSLELPLGWTLSRVTHNLVAFVNGWPKLCDTIGNSENTNSMTLLDIVKHNSCVQRDLIDLINVE